MPLLSLFCTLVRGLLVYLFLFSPAVLPLDSRQLPSTPLLLGELPPLPPLPPLLLLPALGVVAFLGVDSEVGSGCLLAMAVQALPPLGVLLPSVLFTGAVAAISLPSDVGAAAGAAADAAVGVAAAVAVGVAAGAAVGVLLATAVQAVVLGFVASNCFVLLLSGALLALAGQALGLLLAAVAGVSLVSLAALLASAVFTLSVPSALFTAAVQALPLGVLAVCFVAVAGVSLVVGHAGLSISFSLGVSLGVSLGASLAGSTLALLPQALFVPVSFAGFVPPSSLDFGAVVSVRSLMAGQATEAVALSPAETLVSWGFAAGRHALVGLLASAGALSFAMAGHAGLTSWLVALFLPAIAGHALVGLSAFVPSLLSLPLTTEVQTLA